MTMHKQGSVATAEPSAGHCQHDPASCGGTLHPTPP